MTLYFRLFLIILLAKFRKKPEPLGPVRTPFRVWPSDLDMFGHMTNSRYFALMDLGRTDLMFRSGLVGDLRSRGWYPVVVEESMQFKRSLNLLESFELKTEITGFDERHIILRQTFLHHGKVAALALVRARFLGPKGSRVSPQDILSLRTQVTPGAVPIAPEEMQKHAYLKKLIEVENRLRS